MQRHANDWPNGCAGTYTLFYCICLVQGGNTRSMLNHRFAYSASRPQPGFTLVELLATLAVAAIALALAVPSFNGLITSNRLSSASNDLITAISQARLQAIQGNQTTLLCASSNNGTDALGNACTTLTNAGPGAVITTDSGGAVLVQAQLALPGNVQLASMQALRFAGTGLGRTATGSNTPYTGLVADISSNRSADGNHRCVYLTTGSIVNTCTTSATCPSTEPDPCE